MKSYLIGLFVVFCSVCIKAQEGYQMKGNNDYTEIDILSSYYSQDGNNAAVTGGIGTEELTDISTVFVINMPFDSTKSLNVSFGADYYTSASTDQIDNNPSSASSKDVRTYGNIGFTKKNLSKGTTYGVRIGGSSEYDYTSINGGINYAKEFNQGNSEISFVAQAFVDNWETYFPRELKESVSVSTTSRNSFNGQLTFAQVINKKMQIALSAEAIYMDGLLSTPFHRVYFADQSSHDIERLPSSRLKIPLSIRATFFPLEKMVVRTYYRYYTDDFGITAHTASIELPIKLSESFTMTPFYRYHSQSESDYFAPFETHVSTQEFYSSDYDLSALSSNKYGLQIGYSPLYGLSRAKIPFTKKVFILNGINLRASKYTRDTGLDAYAVSLELNIRI